jgi:hypothetical protein
MSSGGQTTTTQNQSPWSAQQPYLAGLFPAAQNAYNLYGSNPASSVAGFTQPQQTAFGATADAFNGSNPGSSIAGVNNSSNSYLTGLLNGNGLNSNPANGGYQSLANGSSPADSTFSSFANGSMMNNPFESSQLNALMDPITRAYQTATAPGISSQMESAGRYGSGAMANADSQAQQNLVQQLGNVAAPVVSNMYQTNLGNELTGATGLSSNVLGGLGGLGGNYNTAAQQQLQGSFNAPNINNQNWQTVGNLGNVGAQQQTLNQSILNSPFNLLGQYGGLIQGNYGGTANTTQPYFTNPGAGALGGALAGSQLGSMTGLGSGWGAGIGGLLGLIH